MAPAATTQAAKAMRVLVTIERRFRCTAVCPFVSEARTTSRGRRVRCRQACCQEDRSFPLRWTGRGLTVVGRRAQRDAVERDALAVAVAQLRDLERGPD